MDKTQLYIIKQNALTNANVFYGKDETKTEEKVLATAQQFADWVIGAEATNAVADLPKTPDNEKKWLNKNTPDFNEMINYIKQGGTVKQIRNKYKVSKEVESELNKL